MEGRRAVVGGEGCAWEKEVKYYLSRCHLEEGDLEHPATGENKCLTL